MRIIELNINLIKIRDNRSNLNNQPLSHFVWNHYNPNNPWRKGYHVHHKDKIPFNDHISNLELLTMQEHTSLHHKGKIVSEETRKKLGLNSLGNEYWLGRKHTEESKKKMSEIHKGKPSSFKGRKHTEEAKYIISKSQIGKKAWNKGIKMSEETKKKLSEKTKGKILSEEHKRKISESMLKRK